MPNYTQATIIGHLTRDPESKTLPSGMQIAEFSVAVNSRRKDKNGSPVEKVAFLDCKAFGKTADTICQYFSKGKPILVNCRIEQDTWETKEGQKRSKVVFIVSDFAFVGGRGDSADEGAVAAVRGGKSREIAANDEGVPF